MSENNNEKEDIKVTVSGQYIKDLSFENPQSPRVYTDRNFSPEIKVLVDINVKNLQETLFEISMNITADAIAKEKKVFILELVYAGIFNIQNIKDEEELKEVSFIYCPSLLFPFARQIISNITQGASFPPLLLDTINFRGLYESKKDAIIKYEK
ncbi:MAG: protein-export chaperone SecB [Rickettsiales bacterium]|jgi:preprotein translocase subunit SecB|nr:protein-export chaperone SecB [Rickettsiales bacterium]